jgi:Na+/H+ antiporter NhaD/arsenite permease-like protein
MIVVAHLRLSGFFRLVTSWALARAHSPLVLLATITTTAGAFSAFLVNDAVCLVMTPLVIEMTRSLRRDPIPYLLAVAMASNIGSVATITGNPQNMIVGAVSRIPYVEFVAALAPLAIFGLILVIVVLATLWLREFGQSTELAAKPPVARVHKPQLVKAVVVTLGVIAAFFCQCAGGDGRSPWRGTAARDPRSKAHKVYQEIDGSLLLMFAGLFVVVAAAEKILLTPDVISAVQAFHFAHSYVLTFDTAVLSNLISNVPAVLALKPLVLGLSDQHRTWLIIAMSATLAGNLTPVGSVATLIVAERARAAGIHLSLWAYCRAGVPIGLATLALGAWWLS